MPGSIFLARIDTHAKALVHSCLDPSREAAKLAELTFKINQNLNDFKMIALSKC